MKLEATGDVKLSLDGVGGRHRRALVWEDVNRREVTPERVGRTAALQVVAQHLQVRKMVLLKIVEVLVGVKVVEVKIVVRVVKMEVSAVR